MRHPIRILLLALMLVPPAGAAAVERSAVFFRTDSLLAAASDTTLPAADRERLLKDLAREDRSGRSQAAIARFYLKGDEGKDRSRLLDAQLWVDRAIRLDRKNADFLALRAELLWRLGGRESAFKEAAKAVTQTRIM